MKVLSIIYVALLILLSSLCNVALGQFVSSGGISSKTEWMQVRGETYDVVYPQGMDSLAKRYLWLLEQNKRAVMLGLGGIKPARIPVVLYNASVRSNGTVVWAPKRMELFTMPSMNGYAQRWDEQLAVHESRHVGQMTHFTKGIYKLGSWIIGQQAPSLGVAIYPSRWMLEGDAVVAETELSNAGRGRNAEFMEYYRASFLEGDIRKWERWKQGSYKYYTPNLYAFGYLTNSTIRYKSGNYDYAGEVFDGFVKNFYTPFARDVSYNAAVGETPRRFFRQGREMMTAYWRDELPKRGILTRGTQVLQKRERGYQEYRSPVAIGKDSILYLKYSFSNPAELVLIDSGVEKHLRGFAANVEQVRRVGDKLYFVEQIKDARWSNEVYGVLYSYDLRSGDVVRLGEKGYYGYIQTNEDGSLLSAVEYHMDGTTSLVIMDIPGGNIVQRIKAPFNGEFAGSAWAAGQLYASVVDDRGLGIFKYEEGEWKTVIGEQSASVSNLNGDEDNLYFLSDMDGVRNVYMFNVCTLELKRLTNERYGATEPHISNGTLYYSSLETGGRFPVKLSVDTIGECGSEFSPRVENGRLLGAYRYFVADELSDQAHKALEENGMLADRVAVLHRNGTSIVKYTESEEEFSGRIKPEKYSKLEHLFRFHSWAPLYYNVERIMEADYDKLYEVLALGATAYSQNTLGTAVSMLGYSYREGLHAGHFRMKYSGWYPSIQIGADINNEHRYNVKLVREGDKISAVAERMEKPLVELSALAYVPLDFSSHGWNRGVVPQVKWDFNNNGYYDYAKEKYLFSNTLTTSLQFYQMREMAHSGIYPKWGFGGVARWRSAIGGGENFGRVHSMYLYGYIPGVAPKHGIKLSLSAQKQNAQGKNYYLSNLVNMPRGYKDDVYGEKYVMASADYAFPVYLGDTHIWRLAYFKRMQIIPFADYAVCNRVSERSGKTTATDMYSYGTAVMLDFAPFSIGLELSLGVQYSYNGNNGNIPVERNTFKVLVSTSLF